MSASYVGSLAPGAYWPDRISPRSNWTICSAFRDGIDALQGAHLVHQPLVPLVEARCGRVPYKSSLTRRGGRDRHAHVTDGAAARVERVPLEARVGRLVRPDGHGRRQPRT